MMGVELGEWVVWSGSKDGLWLMNVEFGKRAKSVWKG